LNVIRACDLRASLGETLDVKRKAGQLTTEQEAETYKALTATAGICTGANVPSDPEVLDAFLRNVRDLALIDGGI
jgi:hypothetical protein